MTEIEYKKEFLSKHHNEFKVTTQPMMNDSYVKLYECDDGATLYEVNSPSYEKAVASVHGIEVEVEIKLLKTELWNTDNSESVFFWSKY